MEECIRGRSRSCDDSTDERASRRRRRHNGNHRKGCGSSHRGRQLHSRDAQRHGAHCEASVRRQRSRHDTVSRGEITNLSAVARNAPDAYDGDGQSPLRRLRSLPDCLSGELHQARTWRGRGGQPLSARIRDRRVPLHLLRLLPGSLPRGGDPRRSPLRELRVQPRRIRLRSAAPDGSDPPGLRNVGSGRPEGRVMDPHYPLFYVFHFYLFGVIALVSAITFVTRKSPVAAALWLVNTMFSLAALYVMLDAQFIGVMQVLVYAGAIMVVFLFVVMLLNLGHPSELADARGLGWRLAAGLVGLGLLSEIMIILRAKLPQQLIVPRDFNEQQLQKLNAVGTVAAPLFKDYLLAFELTSVLLLVAIAGAVILGRGRTVSAR